MVSPLPIVLELCCVRRLVVGRIHIGHARFKTGIHDVEILVRKRNIDQQIGVEPPDQRGQLGDIVRVHLRCFDRARNIRGNAITLLLGPARETDLLENLRNLGALVRHDIPDSARADDQHIRHVSLSIQYEELLRP